MIGKDQLKIGMLILSLSNMYVFFLKGEGVTSRNAVGGVSFCVCLVLTVSTFRSGDWMSARSILPVNVMITTISEPIRHPRLL